MLLDQLEGEDQTLVLGLLTRIVDSSDIFQRSCT